MRGRRERTGGGGNVIVNPIFIENNRQTVLPTPAHLSITLPIDWLSSQSFKEYVLVRFCSVQRLFNSDLHKSLPHTHRGNYGPQCGLNPAHRSIVLKLFINRYLCYHSVASNVPPAKFNQVENTQKLNQCFKTCTTCPVFYSSPNMATMSMFSLSLVKCSTKHLTACWRLSISCVIFCSKESHCMVLITSRWYILIKILDLLPNPGCSVAYIQHCTFCMSP